MHYISDSFPIGLQVVPVSKPHGGQFEMKYLGKNKSLRIGF